MKFNFIDNLSESDERELIENLAISFIFKFDFENNIIGISAGMLDSNNEYFVDEIEGNVFLDENGKIDAVMDLGDDHILLSEMCGKDKIDNCGWFSNIVKSVVKVLAVTTVSVVAAAAIVGTCGAGAIAVIGVVGTVTCAVSTSQTVRANINYSNNKKAILHDDITHDGYITDQSKYNDWSFGFATLDDVGCEVIAVYNIMIALNKKRELYDIIYDFEILNIDYDLGFGHLGSNPKQIFRYLESQCIPYLSFYSLSTLKEVSNSLDNCHIILSSLNNHSVAGIHSLHTFIIQKNIYGNYYSYNGYYMNYGKQYKDLDEFIQYKFDYAYIVFEGK
ncbi:MAG: hypothetical protein HUJ61_00900 [Bacilli bacterium]|nr:hypothetical protein [Bacilli bacterium]